jgi:hypothetical protein
MGPFCDMRETVIGEVVLPTWTETEEGKVAIVTRSPSERLTRNLAQEVCQRAGSKAYLAGSIAALGTQYVIGLEALNCASGDVLQVTAAGKEQILEALGQAASKLRSEVGESLSSVQKFDVPLSEATTNSLEALKAYTLGAKAQREKGDVEAIAFQKRAIELDLNFALAYDKRSRQGAAMRRRRRRWPTPWRAMQLTPRHLRMTLPSDSRRILWCSRSGFLLSARR